MVPRTIPVMVICFCWWLWFTWDLALSYPQSDIAEDLYSHSDPVHILYTENITKFISDEHQDGKKIQLVQFYNSFCGHCQHFAPFFKQFLHSTMKWRNLVDFSVVNCQPVENLEACKRYVIRGYPTLRTFWFKPTESDLGEDFPMQGWPSVRDLRNSFLQQISDHQHKVKSEDVPDFWPDFRPLTEIEQIEKFSKDDQQRTVLIVVEKIRSYFGRELMMNFSCHFDEMKIYRMEESSIRILDQILPNILEDYRLPLLLYWSPKTKQFAIISKPTNNQQDDYEYFPKIIQQRFIRTAPSTCSVEQVHSEVNKATVLKTVADNNPTNSSIKKSYIERVYMIDLMNAIRFALFHEVQLKNHLNLEQVEALIRFLNVLYESFPFPGDNSREFIKHLHDWVVKRSNRNRAHPENILNTDDMLAIMKIYEEHYRFPEQKPYQACADISTSLVRSYPCSLWSLFHVLTVSEYRRTLTTKQWSALHASLYAMRAYVKNFFGCTQCAQHFLEMAKNLENELIYRNSSVMWLWRAHNQANARLKGEGREEPSLPKRQFPTYDECSDCYHQPPPSSSPEIHKDYARYINYYNEEKILPFLVHFYDPDRIVGDDSEITETKRNMFEDLPPEDSGGHPPEESIDGDIIMKSVVGNSASKPGSRILMIVSSPFTQTDMKLIFVFYALSILLLISICSYVRLRRNIFHKVFNFKQRVY